MSIIEHPAFHFPLYAAISTPGPLAAVLLRIVMTDGKRIVTVPRHDPVDAFTMGGIVQDAGLTPRRFRDLL